MNASRRRSGHCARPNQLKELLALHEAALATHVAWPVHGRCRAAARPVQQALSRHVRSGCRMWRGIGMPIAELIAHSAARGNFPVAQLEDIKRRRLDTDGARRAVPADAPDVARAHVRDGLSPAAGRRLGHAGRRRHRAPARAIRAAHQVRALRPGDQSDVARPVRGRRRSPHRAVQRALRRNVRPVRGRDPGRRVDARRDRARGAARLFPRAPAARGLAAAAGQHESRASRSSKR